MKIAGVTPSGPTEEVLVLPRANGDVIFRARAVVDLDEFNAMCPMPKAPGMLTKDGFRANVDAPAYKEMVQRRSNLHMAYIVIKSLEPSEIEWDSVQDDKPDTWPNWEEDLKNAGFNSVEIQRIFVCCLQANSLDETKLKLAREAFLAGQGNQSGASTGQSTEPESTQSGEPATDGE
jgi:hypothetical protein